MIVLTNYIFLATYAILFVCTIDGQPPFCVVKLQVLIFTEFYRLWAQWCTQNLISVSHLRITVSNAFHWLFFSMHSITMDRSRTSAYCTLLLLVPCNWVTTRITGFFTCLSSWPSKVTVRSLDGPVKVAIAGSHRLFLARHDKFWTKPLKCSS